MQNNNHYYNYKSGKFGLNANLYDSLLYQINSILFYYGNHHKQKKPFFFQTFFLYSKTLFLYIFGFFFFVRKRQDKIIISNAYVDIHFNDYILLSSPWHFSRKKKIFCSKELLKIILKIEVVLSKRSIRLLFSSSFQNLIQLYDFEFSKLLNNNNVKCVIVPNDLSFFENLSIKIAQKNKVPSFVYLHGLPARYNNIDDNRADYLLVWGTGIKEAYIDCGVSADKVLTVKHPVYSDFYFENLVSNLSNILVLTKPISGTPSSSNELFFGDRSKSLLYLELVMDMLIEIGVKQAKLRLHPSESINFYRENLTSNFYSFDNEKKNDSLRKATLVIGPSSTMVLDAIKSGVNYILFDPIIDNCLLDNSNKLVPPFDGSSFINKTDNISDLIYNIENPIKNINLFRLNKFFNVDKNDTKKLFDIIK